MTNVRRTRRCRDVPAAKARHLIFLYCSYTFTNRLANVRRFPNRKERKDNATAAKASVADTLHDLVVRKGSKGCDDFFLTC